MPSDFLDKFKGKTNKVPKEGVTNLLEASLNSPSKQPKNKLIDVKPHSIDKDKKSNMKQKK